MNTQETRKRLLARLEELTKRAARVQADQRRESDPLSPDFADQATQRENDSVLDAIGESTRAELKQVQAAIRRLEAGTYGICSRCGQAIDAERLRIVPHADRCRGCAG